MKKVIFAGAYMMHFCYDMINLIHELSISTLVLAEPISVPLLSFGHRHAYKISSADALHVCTQHI